MKRLDWVLIAGLVVVSLSLLAWQHDLKKREEALPLPVASFTGVRTELVVSPLPRQTFQVGKPMTIQLQVENGTPPYHWYVESGELLPGLRLDERTGLISGTPLPESLSMPYQCVIGVEDSEGRVGVAQ